MHPLSPKQILSNLENGYFMTHQEQEEAAQLIRQLQAKLAEPRIPAKIIGPNLEEILNAAGFYRGDAVCCNDYEKCIKPCTPKGEWLAKKELAKPWVGLTINEVWDAYEEGNYDDVRFARAIEQLLKDKNERS